MAFVMAISAEPVPGAGIFRVLRISTRSAWSRRGFHSTTYADPAALDGIAAFIAQRRNALATRLSILQTKLRVAGADTKALTDENAAILDSYANSIPIAGREGQ